MSPTRKAGAVTRVLVNLMLNFYMASLNKNWRRRT
nr:MAG TPA: hypothetical protein [Caudoviricetes sp.]